MVGETKYSCTGKSRFLNYIMERQIKQINSEGQAIVSGIDVFMSTPIYSGEYLSYGNSFLLLTISGAPDYATSTADYASEVISNAPPTVLNSWYRYHTEGTVYTTITSPSTSTNSLAISAVNTLGVTSHAGIYQQLTGLNVGSDYEVTIDFHESSHTGTISFTRFYYAFQNFTTALQTEVITASIPSSKITFTFNASSTNDIVFFDLSTTISAVNISISCIKIQLKDEIQLPVISDIPAKGFCKVLRKNDGGKLSTDLDPSD